MNPPNKKKTIALVIDNLARGGAETMLVSLLKPLSENYSIILVTLNSKLDFSEDEIICDARLCLNYNSIKEMPWAIMKLKNIINKYKPDLVHCQLFWSTIIGRFSVPKQMPFIFSIHNKLSIDAFQANKLSYFLEKYTYRSRHTIISVSEDAMIDYKKFINVKGRSIVLNNFVDAKFFTQPYDFTNRSLEEIKIVAVGNLRHQKNYEFLLNVLNSIKDKIKIQLDIIGEGPLRYNLQSIIDKNHLNVNLLGQKANVELLLPNYDAFIMSSFYEGFGNAPVEAMAVGLPLILNDLEVMKEMSKGNALFYESGNEQLLAELLLNLPSKKEELVRMSEQGKLNAKENYSPEHYVTKLKKIYENLIDESLKTTS